MTATAVIATIGEDRPGIVADLSRLVLELELNIEDSRMSVLGGEFAVLMSVTGSSKALAELEKRLGGFADETGLAHLFRKTSERTHNESGLCRVTVAALDHPGIVQRVAAFFSDRQVNVRELSTDTRPAPHTGTPVFNLLMEVELPAQVQPASVKAEFIEFCAANDLDGTLEV